MALSCLALACTALLVHWAGPGPVAAQTLPLLDSTRTRLITEEISGDAAYAHMRFMTQYHRPRGGDNNLWTVAQYHERKAREYGLTEVSLIRQASTTRPWNASFADLWIDGAQPERIASTIQSAAHLADYSRPADVRGELIDIGGGSAAELAGKELTGKVVLSTGNVNASATPAELYADTRHTSCAPSSATPST